MDDFIECSSCFIQFEVIWIDDWSKSEPKYCPFCGVELENYDEDN